MARRRVTEQGRAALVARIRADIRSGDLLPGMPLPSLRELGEQYGLSHSTVKTELEPLVAQGLLRTRPRAGFYVAGSDVGTSSDYYLMVGRDPSPGSLEWVKTEAIRRGFERAVSRNGGHVLCLRASEISSSDVQSSLPPIAGVFVFLARPATWNWTIPADCPQVHWDYVITEPIQAQALADRLHFDDLDGGRLAASHLIRRGHRRIAFMALHTSPPTLAHQWSQERESGWRAAMRQAFPSDDLVSFHAMSSEMTPATKQADVSRRIAQRMLTHRDSFDAVVASDDLCLASLVSVWRENDVPPPEWPAMVGFEGMPEVGNYVLTSVVPPWERLGESAGELLWQRRTGRVTGPPVERVVPMELASRLSSVKEWNTEGAANALIS